MKFTCPKIRGKKNTMGPACLLTPKTAEVVSYSIVGRLCQAAVFAFTKFVVALCDLPNCSSSVDFLARDLWRLTMRIYRDSLPPS